jgi:heptaprenyl diphosphate synthase
LNDAVSESGGLNFTGLLSKRYYAKARALIKELDASEEKRDRLYALLDKAHYGLKKKAGNTHG